MNDDQFARGLSDHIADLMKAFEVDLSSDLQKRLAMDPAQLDLEILYLAYFIEDSFLSAQSIAASRNGNDREVAIYEKTREFIAVKLTLTDQQAAALSQACNTYWQCLSKPVAIQTPRERLGLEFSNRCGVQDLSIVLAVATHIHNHRTSVHPAVTKTVRDFLAGD